MGWLRVKGEEMVPRSLSKIDQQEKTFASKRSKSLKLVTSYLHFDVIDALSGSDDRPANHRRECVLGKVGARVATLDELYQTFRCQN